MKQISPLISWRRESEEIPPRCERIDLKATGYSLNSQTNIVRFAYKVTINSLTFNRAMHGGNYSSSPYYNSSSSLRFSFVVGGGLGNLSFKVRVYRSTALITALSPPQRAKSPTTLNPEACVMIRSIHFYTLSYFPDIMHSIPSLESSNTFSGLLDIDGL
jgi:hypothetical protein